MPQSPEQMTASMIANMKEKTGRTMDQWLKIARSSKKEKHGEIVRHLKGDHGLTHGYANLVAHTLLNAVPRGGEDLVAAQYAGKKEGLKPLYDELVSVVKKLGKDVEISPKKTYVSLRRSKQFGLIQPSTATRIDVGINLKGVPPSGRLEKSGSFNAMVTHRVRVERKADVDADLKRWLRQAYEAS